MHSSTVYLVAFLLGAASEEQSNNPLLRDIRSVYHEREHGIRTLLVRFRHMPPVTEEGEYSDDIDEKRLEWCISGNKQRLKREPWAAPNTPADLPPMAQWDSFDGVTGYQVVFWPRQPDIVSRIFRSKVLPNALRNNPLPACLGVQLPNSSIRLADHLNRPGTHVDSQELLGDVLCTKIELEPYEAVPGVKHRLFVWFDNKNEFAIRKLELGSVRLFTHRAEQPQTPFQLQNDETYNSFHTIALRTFHDPIAGKDRVFPVSWANTVQAKPWLIVDDIAVNQTVASSEFVPDFPVGAEIVDLHNQGKPNDSYVVGGEEGLAVKRRYQKDNRVETADVTTPAGSPPQPAFEHNASPPPPVSYQKWSLVISGCSCLVVLYLVFKRRAG